MELKFRKKPIVIEAFQMTEERRASNADWPQWMHQAWQLDRKAPGSLYPTEEGTGDGTLSISTLEGQHPVSWGDWIIQGVQGELYPCKPDIFAKTYEPAEASPASVPANFKMVPVEPTPEMLTAGECESDSDRATYETVYAAMIASAPTPATWPDGTPRAFDNYAHDKQFSEDSPTPPVSEDWKDAKRYRWLRKEWFREDEDNSWFMQSESSFLESPDEFDAAIDAAMQEGKP